MKQATLNLQLPRQVDSFLKNQLNIQLLKYAAGQHIVCSNCGEIMDWRRTVTAELSRHLPGEPEEVIGSYTMCAKCWDKNKANLEEGMARAVARRPDLNPKLDVVDGRTFQDPLDN